MNEIEPNPRVQQGKDAVPALYWRLLDIIYAVGQNANEWPALLAALAACYRQPGPGAEDDDNPRLSLDESALSRHLEQALALNDHLKTDTKNDPVIGSLLAAPTFPYLIVDENWQVIVRGEHYAVGRHGRQELCLAADGKSLSLVDLAGKTRRGIEEVVGGKRSAVVHYSALAPAETTCVIIALSEATRPKQRASRLSLFAWFDDVEVSTGQLEDLALLHVLTPAETELLPAVLAHRSYAEIAQQRSVTLNTIRSQVKALLAKTGTRSRTELVQLLLCGPGLLNRVLGDRHHRYFRGGSKDQRLNQRLVLPNGRQLGFAEYGPEEGVPVLLMHNVSGSRLQIPVPEDRLYEQHIRLLIPDRLGVGLTDGLLANDQTAKSRAEWAAAIEALLDHLQLPPVFLVGASVGAVWALACAHLTPHRFTRMALISPMSAFTTEADLSSMSPDIWNLISLGRESPQMLHELGQFITRGTPNAYLDRLIPELPQCDQVYYTDRGFYEMALDALRENMHRGIDSMVHDFVQLSDPWLEQVQPIALATQCWQGDRDIIAAPPTVERLSDALADCQLIRIPGETHMLIYRHWNTIAAHLLNPEFVANQQKESAG